MPATIVKRGSDMLITVDVENAAKTTATEIATSATTNSEIPAYKPDGCGAILLFHTPDHHVHGLGGLRDNFALKNELTVDNSPFPPQVNTTIGGGYLFDADQPLRESIMKQIKNKIFFNPATPKDSPIYGEQETIKSLIKTIESSEGWTNDVCVHTSYWQNDDGTTGTMCYLTAIKHINCTHEDLEKIVSALKTIMEYKHTQGESPRNLSNYQFYPFINTMQNATAEYLIKRTELEKAQIAYQQKAPVTFNDLCLETFRINDTYTKPHNGCSELSLPRMNLVPTL